MTKGKSKSSRRWLQRQANDPYVKQARQQGWRSRAAIKIQQLDEQNHLFAEGMRVLDLGAAPGGWSQYAVSKTGERGYVVAVDLAPVKPIAGVDFIQADLFADETPAKIAALLGDKRADLVISDIAPNMTGMAVIDMPKTFGLAEIALDMAERFLHEEGAFLVKVFQGEGIDEYRNCLRQRFLSVAARKPPASRSDSGEIYLLARRLKNFAA